jgi:putative DNA primase/helicase
LGGATLNDDQDNTENDGGGAAITLSPERVDDIRARWSTADPETREQLFAELSQGYALRIKAENERLARGYDGSVIVLPAKPRTESPEAARNVRHDLACREYPLSDIGNSQRFAFRKKGVTRYCHAFRSWFIWDGRRWCKDLTGKIVELAKDVIIRIGDEAISQEYTADSANHYKWAIKSQARPRIDAAVYLVQSVLAIEPRELDARTYLLNLPNGTLNLLTGELLSHRKEDLLTRIAGVEFRPGLACPLWIQHLHMIFNGDQELIDAFQQVVGYTLLQDNPEQVLFILYGSGKNGKSKTIEVLSHLLGEYAINIAAESLMSKRFNEGPRSDIARIANARLVSASEGESGARLAESLIKALTGGDIVTVRRLYENEIEFRPTAKIWYATNHRPVILGTDDAIWRRIWLIPFTIAIPEDRRDPEIVAKLLQEGSGILNWALAGLQKYQKAGRLIQPEKVKIATEEYRQDSDILKDFLEASCQQTGEIKRSDLYHAYTDWCEANHEKPVGSKKFTGMIRDRGVGERRDTKDRYWIGISMRGFWK